MFTGMQNYFFLIQFTIQINTVYQYVRENKNQPSIIFRIFFPSQ